VPYKGELHLIEIMDLTSVLLLKTFTAHWSVMSVFCLVCVSWRIS